MTGRRRLVFLALLLAAAGSASRSGAQSQSGYGQVTLFGSYQQTSLTGGGPSSTFSETSAYVSLVSKPADDGGFEYGLDARGAAYPSVNGQPNRLSSSTPGSEGT